MPRKNLYGAAASYHAKKKEEENARKKQREEQDKKEKMMEEVKSLNIEEEPEPRYIWLRKVFSRMITLMPSHPLGPSLTSLPHLPAVYVLRCRIISHLYVGETLDLRKRMRQHARGRGEEQQWLKSSSSLDLVWCVMGFPTIFTLGRERILDTDNPDGCRMPIPLVQEISDESEGKTEREAGRVRMIGKSFLLHPVEKIVKEVLGFVPAARPWLLSLPSLCVIRARNNCPPRANEEDKLE